MTHAAGEIHPTKLTQVSHKTNKKTAAKITFKKPDLLQYINIHINEETTRIAEKQESERVNS